MEALGVAASGDQPGAGGIDTEAALTTDRRTQGAVPYGHEWNTQQPGPKTLH